MSFPGLSPKPKVVVPEGLKKHPTSSNPYIYVDAQGRMHNLTPEPCAYCGDKGRFCLMCGRGMDDAVHLGVDPGGRDETVVLNPDWVCHIDLGFDWAKYVQDNFDFGEE